MNETRVGWTVTMPQSLLDALRELAKKERRPLNTQIVMALEEAVKAKSK